MLLSPLFCWVPPDLQSCNSSDRLFDMWSNSGWIFPEINWLKSSVAAKGALSCCLFSRHFMYCTWWRWATRGDCCIMPNEMALSHLKNCWHLWELINCMREVWKRRLGYLHFPSLAADWSENKTKHHHKPAEVQMRHKKIGEGDITTWKYSGPCTYSYRKHQILLYFHITFQQR